MSGTHESRPAEDFDPLKRSKEFGNFVYLRGNRRKILPRRVKAADIDYDVGRLEYFLRLWKVRGLVPRGDTIFTTKRCPEVIDGQVKNVGTFICLFYRAVSVSWVDPKIRRNAKPRGFIGVSINYRHAHGCPSSDGFKNVPRN